MTPPAAAIVALPVRPAPHIPHVDHSGDQERLERLSPREFLLNGVKTLLYTIGDLASMLYRSSVTMRKWERLGILPRTPYVLETPDSLGGRRLYSGPMILGLVRIAREENILTPYGPPLSSTNFATRAMELFKSLINPASAAPAGAA